MSGQDTHINQYQEVCPTKLSHSNGLAITLNLLIPPQERGTARSTSAHPTDSSIALTLHQPLYPPGRIIHIVRHHPKAEE